MAPAALHGRIVGGLLSNGLLIGNVGTALARYECLDPEAERSGILGAMVDAFELALSNARLAASNGHRYPRGATPYSLEDLEARRVEFAAIFIMAHDGFAPPGTAQRFGIGEDEIARAAAIATALGEALP